ncbi:RNase H family protein [Thermosipho globiformans]|uniref:RNase H family protein n=1 Tax=Thermosipho globiformans TaxID=380685 RepID=UPI000F8DBCA7|nr:RNase H family protein [Thermosipho globiformans]
MFFSKKREATTIKILAATSKEVANEFVENILCIKVYIDGSYSSETKKIGFSIVILSQKIEKFYKSIENEELAKHRNVSGEILAVLYALEIAKQKGFKCITLYYDYEGLEKWITGEWRTKTPLTKAYKEKFYNYSKDIKVKFEKVKSHTGVKYNELADKLAKQAVEANKSNIDFEVVI